MNLLISIFGGMLLTVVLYGVGRRLRLSNFWAAVLAAGLPSFAYVAYAVAAWPGLDVLTLHVVTYPTVAVLMYQLYGEKGERHGRMHWAPKLLVGFFVLITVLFAGFVYVAGHGLPPAIAHWFLPDTAGKAVHTGFAGVVAHGEDAAKSIAHHRRMEAKLEKLGWHVEVVGLDTLRADHANALSVHVRDREGVPVPGVRVEVALGRPGQPAVQTLQLEDGGAAGYHAMAALPGDGTWLAAIALVGMGERVVLEHVIGGE